MHGHGSAVEQQLDVVGTYYPERVITGELRSKVDRVWDAFWSGGISNPLEVIEQITYLLFMRRLDDLQTLAEGKARATKQPLENPVFLPGQTHLRWGRLKDLAPEQMYQTVSDEVFPFLRQLGGEESTYGEHMKDARFTIPTAALLSRVVDMLDDIPMADRDTNGGSATRRAARAGSWWQPASTCASTTPARCGMRSSAAISIGRCSTATTSTARCCASAA